MSKRIIMLVDDNKIDLFIHSEIIKRMSFEKTILQFVVAEDALNFLREKSIEEWPDIILLDIHMPIMNGFDFITEYLTLPAGQRAKPGIIMVSSSLAPGDLKMAKSIPEVIELLEKPLNMDKLYALLNQEGQK